jgi:hypothetical protein
VPGQQRFAQHERTEQNGANGYQERDQQQVCIPGRGQNAKIERVGERGGGEPQVDECGTASSQGLSAGSMIGSSIKVEALTLLAAVASGATPMRWKLRPKMPAKAYDSAAARQASRARRLALTLLRASGPIITAAPAKPATVIRLTT